MDYGYQSYRAIYANFGLGVGDREGLTWGLGNQNLCSYLFIYFLVPMHSQSQIDVYKEGSFFLAHFFPPVILALILVSLSSAEERGLYRREDESGGRGVKEGGE